MRWNEAEIRALVPEARIIEVLGFDPRLKVSFDGAVQQEDLLGFNTLISCWAYENGRQELLHAHFGPWHKRGGYHAKMGRPHIPQFLIKDYAGFLREIVLLHVGTVKGRELFLEDIVLANPHREWDKPLLGSQRFPSMGNGIFDLVLQNLESLARRHGFVTIAGQLCAADLIPILDERGYHVDREHPLYPVSQKTGHQIPVRKVLE